MKKRLLLTVIATMMVATLLTGCGGSATTDTEPTENTEVESIVETTESTETEIVEETELTEVVESTVTVETETPASEETESEVVDTTSEETEPEKPAYTYTDMDKTMWAKSSVNVRSLPSTDGEKLGGLSARQEVHVTGQCNETGWYRIDYNGNVAYVSDSYLVNEKPAEPQPEEPTQPSEPKQPEELPFELYVVYDTGDKIYFWDSPNDHSADATEKRRVAQEQCWNIGTERWGMENCTAYFQYDSYDGKYFMYCLMKTN